MRVAPVPVQPALPDLDLPDAVSLAAVEPWWELPEPTRTAILTLLARLIARCVLTEDTAESAEAGDE